MTNYKLVPSIQFPASLQNMSVSSSSFTAIMIKLYLYASSILSTLCELSPLIMATNQRHKDCYTCSKRLNDISKVMQLQVVGPRFKPSQSMHRVRHNRATNIYVYLYTCMCIYMCISIHRYIFIYSMTPDLLFLAIHPYRL